MMPSEDTVFEAVFSLGNNCIPAHQIERFFGQETSSCFDWIVSPYSSIIKIFENDGDDFCLDFTKCLEGKSVVCNRYGVLYHHEFKRDISANVIVDLDVAKLSRQKLIYKYNKMIEIAKEHTTLFIRYGSGTDAPSDTSHIDDHALDILEDVIRRKIGHDNFEFCYVFQEGYAFETASLNKRPNRRRLFSDRFIPEQLGDDSVWNAIFSSYNLSAHSLVMT